MFKYVKAFFRGLYKILFSYPKIRRYAKNKDKYSLEERYAFVRKLVGWFFKAFRVEINAEGFDKLDPNQTYLFVSNHQGLTDALTLIYLLDKPMTFIAKKEARDYPFVGKVIYLIDAIFIDRENIRDAVKMIRTSISYLNNGVNVSIYPEGTRTKDENYMTGEYKPGALKPAYETKKDMVVIGIDGSYKVLSKKYKKDLKINIKVLDVFKFGEYGSKNTPDLAKEIQDKTNEYLIEIRKQ